MERQKHASLNCCEIIYSTTKGKYVKGFVRRCIWKSLLFDGSREHEKKKVLWFINNCFAICMIAKKRDYLELPYIGSTLYILWNQKKRDESLLVLWVKTQFYGKEAS